MIGTFVRVSFDLPHVPLASVCECPVECSVVVSFRFVSFRRGGVSCRSVCLVVRLFVLCRFELVAVDPD